MGDPIQRWDDTRWGPASLEAVRALHRPAERYRMSVNCYPAGTTFGGASRAVREYLLAGACAITIGASTWELQAGDIADLPEGAFYFRVLGPKPVELVSVWKLPPQFWPRSDA